MKKNNKKDNLKTLYLIEESLRENGYFDTSRISKEIFSYCIEKNVSPTAVLKRIETNEPWEYIKGKSDFHRLELVVDENTLIPRVETEQLVDIALNLLKQNNHIKFVLDVGTGSGCIIIFLAKKLCKKKNITFLGTDTNSKALKIAKKNSVLHKVNERVSFLKTNLTKEVQIDGPFLMIANLPYIPTDMYLRLDSSVVDFEPQGALDGGKDGLKYYRELFVQMSEGCIKDSVSRQKGFLLMEIEPCTLKDLRVLLNVYNLNNFEVIKDFRNKSRFVLVHLS